MIVHGRIFSWLFQQGYCEVCFSAKKHDFMTIMINLVSHRFSGAHAFYYVKGFLQKVADSYKSDGRARDFVLDLLKLQVPKLLSSESEEEAKKMWSEFKIFLQGFIRRNTLQQALLTQTTAIVVC